MGGREDKSLKEMSNTEIAMELRNNLSLVSSKNKLRDLMATAAARLIANPSNLSERERCAKIAEPWPGFQLDKSSTDIDRAVVTVRTEIAKLIREQPL